MSRYLDRLYSGHLLTSEELTKEPSNQIKVFLSSNSTDFCEERDAIFSRVVPQIREEAKAKYGLEFHYLDLKWGVELREENDFRTREFMLKELLRCQQLSAGPNFVVLLGQKYGHRPPPHLILSEKFELIQNALHGAKGKRARHASLLDVWYTRDENSIPAIHVLQQPTPLHSEERQRDWKVQQEQLKQVLIYGAELCCKEGSLPLEALRTYFASEFENEVRHGLMGSSDESALSVDREIRDLNNYLSETRATAFTELEWNNVEEKWVMVKENQELLKSLKSEVVKGNLPQKNTFGYSILWRYDAGVDPVLHKDYIDSLCEDVRQRISEQIADVAAVRRARQVTRSALETEVLLHWRMAKSKGEECHGRDDELFEVNSYIENGSNNESGVIYGDSGSGTTCFMAKIFVEMQSTLGSDCLVVVRFLGLTQESQNLRSVLQSVCLQILCCLNRTDTLPTEFTELHEFFITLLNSIPESRTIVLLLDSIHNLLPDFNAHLLKWLPRNLSPNVRVLVSCQSHTHGMITRMKTETIENQDNFIELLPFSYDQAMSLLLRWLQKENMAITNNQSELLKLVFKRCTLPLYLQMVFGEIKQWTSYQTVDAASMGSSCETYLNALFDKLESSHGDVIVKHALAYLTASKTGLSDMEMEDLLSLDEAVLSYVHQHTSPVVRRCPPYVWSCLRNDIERFLELRVSDSHDIHYWNHSFLIKYIESRYLHNQQFARSVHHVIADYYLGTWHEKRMKFVDLFGKPGEADRQVISQPLTYKNSVGEVEYNRRKYDQVPRHLFLANRLEELNDKVLFNYDWLYNKIKVLSLEHILADLSLNPSTEATLLGESLRSAQAVLERNINNMPAELSGRLLPYYHAYPNIRKLIQQCDTAGLGHCALVPIFNYQQVPGSPLQHTLNYDAPIDCVHLLSDGLTLVTKSNSSQIVRLFNISSGAIKADISTSYGRMMVSSDGQYLAIIDNEIEKAIKIHRITDGRYEGQLIPLKAAQIKDTRKCNLGAISISDKYVAALIISDTSYLCICELDTVEVTQTITLDRKPHLVHIARNNGYVLCGTGHDVVAYNLESGTQICLTQLEYKPTNLVMAEGCTRVFYFNVSSHVITTCHNTSEGYTQMLSKIHMASQFSGDRIKRLTLSNDQLSLMVLGDRNVVVFNTRTDKLSIHVRKPPYIMPEFQLPKCSEPTPIVYTDALFSPDDQFLLVSLFRSIQLWNIKTNVPHPSSIMAPVGIISTVLLSPVRSQIISLQHHSSCIQVWNLSDNATDMASLDKLNGSIDCIEITADASYCFIKGTDCGEVAVVDLSNGLLANFLTHQSVIEEIVPVNDGTFLLTTVKPQGNELHHKIWSLKERSIIEQFGETRGLTVALKKTKTLIHINQVSTAFRSPYNINIYHFNEDSFHKTTYDFLINHAISPPLVTADDTYMVLLTADEYQESRAEYSNPAICALYLQGRLMHSIIGKSELGGFLDTRHLISLVRIPESRTKVIAIYSQRSADGFLYQDYGYVCINLATGTPIRYSDNFMSKGTDLRTLYLNNAGSQCFHSQSGLVFDMKSGSKIGQIHNSRSPLVLLYNGATVTYFSGSYLIAERVHDNKILAKCDVHVEICYVRPGRDGRSVMVGCVDGTLLNFAVVNTEQVDPSSVLESIPTRRLGTLREDARPSTATTWDRTESVMARSVRSAMSSAVSGLQSDREILRKIRPVYRAISTAKSMTNYSFPMSASYNRSKTCSIM